MNIRFLLAATLCGAAFSAQAAEQIVVVRSISAEGVGNIIGTIRFADSERGLIIDPDVGQLSPGQHGFHVHEHPSCEAADKDGTKVAGLAAGGHYDPHHAGKHAGPEGQGHFGDLPALEVNPEGVAERQMLAPRLKLADIRGRSLIIHAGGDNYSDDPKPLGGGGARIACGVIE
jgi:Cu-Zn family superoxide dismutase